MSPYTCVWDKEVTIMFSDAYNFIELTCVFISLYNV